MERAVTIAAGQVGPGITMDLKRNVKKLNDLLKEAGDKGVNILSFVETCVAPFFPPTLSPDYERFFLEFPNEFLNPLFETAKRYEMVLILPFAEKDGIDYYNSSVIADADGTILGKYRKVTLPSVFPSPEKGGTGTYEKLYFKPGNLGFPVFDTQYGKVGIQICYDRKFPEGSRILALDGAEMIFIPTCAATYGDIKGRFETWGLPERARAYENGVFVVVANKAGEELVDTPFGKGIVRNNMGRSLIINPLGETIVTGSPDKWEVVMAKVDIDEVHRAQKGLPFWRDRRPSEYGRLIQR
jgi:N-carbamoylputrescine amidase